MNHLLYNVHFEYAPDSRDLWARFCAAEGNYYHWLRVPRVPLVTIAQRLVMEVLRRATEGQMGA